MADDTFEDATWEAGFEGDRAVVVSRLGVFRRVFPRPQRYSRRFFHDVYELPIEEWTLPIPSRELLPGCFVETTVELRFQPTFRYASQDLARLPALGAHIRNSFLTLLTDIVEEELKALENPVWLTDGCHAIIGVDHLAVAHLAGVLQLLFELASRRVVRLRGDVDDEALGAASHAAERFRENVLGVGVLTE